MYEEVLSHTNNLHTLLLREAGEGGLPIARFIRVPELGESEAVDFIRLLSEGMTIQRSP